jgi:transcriptional regulator with XRE-family HTH domain
MLRLELLDEGTLTRLLRVAAGLSQHELASRSGVDRRRLSEHERGERPLTSAELGRVRASLDSTTPNTFKETNCVSA